MDERGTIKDRPAEARALRRLRVEALDGVPSGAVVESSDPEPISVGSAEDNALCLQDPRMSRYHAEFSRADSGVQVTDLGSLNGTWIGEFRIERVVVPPGTRLRLGGTRLVVGEGGLASERPEAFATDVPGLVAASPSMCHVASEVRRLSAAAISVLIRGETGTGKEVVANAIHNLSPRARKPFVVVDCGSLPATLIASELFGHERGAFTGADRRRTGAFERAQGGTLLLDEIGELPLALQPSLLGVLERRRFRRVGGEQEIDVDVRVLAATHRDLREAVNRGDFRADLYYRLAVATLVVPPLRSRPEDIEPLARHFVAALEGPGTEFPFGPVALDALRQHRFSGNVRELRNVVEAALAGGGLFDHEPTDDEHELKAPTDDSNAPVTPYRAARSQALERFERNYLTKLVERFDGNASEASRQARMDRNYLVSLLRKHNLR